jgi:hypothetical protein
MKNIILTILIFGITFTSFSQDYFNVNEEYPCQGCVNYSADFNSQKKYTQERISLVFDSIVNSGIEFNYPQGGCQNRAQIMSMYLTKKHKIEHSRIWLFAPIDLVKGDKRTLFINDKNNLTDKIEWNYHVAPSVLVQNGTKVDTLIIDPSINSTKPLKVKEWLDAIGNSNISKYTYLKSDYYFFYTQDNGASTVINGFFYKYEKTSFCTDVITDVTLEKGLAENDMVIYILNKYLKSASNEQFSIFKKYFGNVTTLQNKYMSKLGVCGQTVQDNVAFRTIIEKYPDLLSDSMKYYYERLIYWTETVNKLK